MVKKNGPRGPCTQIHGYKSNSTFNDYVATLKCRVWASSGRKISSVCPEQMNEETKEEFIASCKLASYRFNQESHTAGPKLIWVEWGFFTAPCPLSLPVCLFIALCIGMCSSNCHMSCGVRQWRPFPMAPFPKALVGTREKHWRGLWMVCLDHEHIPRSVSLTQEEWGPWVRMPKWQIHWLEILPESHNTCRYCFLSCCFLIHKRWNPSHHNQVVVMGKWHYVLKRYGIELCNKW